MCINFLMQLFEPSKQSFLLQKTLQIQPLLSTSIATCLGQAPITSYLQRPNGLLPVFLQPPTMVYFPNRSEQTLFKM